MFLPLKLLCLALICLFIGAGPTGYEGSDLIARWDPLTLSEQAIFHAQAIFLITVFTQLNSCPCPSWRWGLKVFRHFTEYNVSAPSWGVCLFNAAIVGISCLPSKAKVIMSNCSARFVHE